MIVYEGTKEEFRQDAFERVLVEKIDQRLFEKLHRHVSEQEKRSWLNSLDQMHIVLEDAGIPQDAGVAVEYNVPQTGKRVDFMIGGYDEKEMPHVVVVELKQWEKLVAIPDSESLVKTRFFHGPATVVHPSYQAWSYKCLIENFNAAIEEEKISLLPCAFLHNYKRQDVDPVTSPQYDFYVRQAPVFCEKEKRELRDFIKRWVKKGDQKKILYTIDNGKIRPSKKLQDAIASMIDGNEEFVMIDEQRVAFELIMKTAIRSQLDGKKRTIICKGGPGTGKSVIAVQLVVALTRKGQTVSYVTKNSAPRSVYKEKLKGHKTHAYVDVLFKNSGAFVDAEPNNIATLIVDEAHRLNEKSGFRHNFGENQIHEIIRAARCSVFFIDERQRVTLLDKGSISEIKKFAKLEGSEISEFELTSQFRCNGSDGYLAWVDNVLGIRQTANYDLNDIRYDIRICDTPHEVLRLVKEKNTIDRPSRVIAGYCWEWPTSKRADPNYHDIKIGDFEMSWNLDGGKVYALNPDSVDQAGCIHTTQGLEFDYVGVIIGDDLRYENETVITDYTKRAKTDTSLKGIKTIIQTDPQKGKALADEIIKNTYRTLMTRGMKGCFIYCTDEALSNYLKARINIQ